MWELKIRCSNLGWMCKTQNMFKNWSGEGGFNRFRLIVGSHLHFTKIDCFGVGWQC